MKSGEKGLIGPGSNDYGRADKPVKEVVKELTPELADKIWKDMQKRLYDEQVSKDAVLHHLKQLKAQMGKLKLDKSLTTSWNVPVQKCMEIIDKKITKIKAQ